ncbi:hypothetical protein L7F22_012712 [Adiantum nelumboides]|nr:hypothetical protein [Adiantum nelumboides]
MENVLHYLDELSRLSSVNLISGTGHLRPNEVKVLSFPETRLLGDGDTGKGLFFAILGAVLFLPGFYYTRIAYYAYKGYKGFSFANIPAV